MFTKLFKLLTLNLYIYSFALGNRKIMEFYSILFSHVISDNFLIISFISPFNKRLILILVCVFVCVCGWGLHAMIRVWRTEDDFSELVPFSTIWVLGIKLIFLGVEMRKCLYLLSLLTHYIYHLMHILSLYANPDQKRPDQGTYFKIYYPTV